MYVIMSGTERKYFRQLTATTFIWVRTTTFATQYETEEQAKAVSEKLPLSSVLKLPVRA